MIVRYDLLSQSVANNSSDIRLYLYLYGSGGGTISWSSGQAWLHNSGWFGIGASYSAGTEYLLKTVDFTLAHNADGTQAFSVGFGISTTWKLNYSGSTGGVGLPTIARASQPSLSGTWTMGNSVTINTNRASGSFTHTLTYSFAGASGTIATGVGASATWTIPKSLANNIPNNTSSTMTITCTTYSGSTNVGSKSTSTTVSVSGDMYPYISSINLSEAVGGLASKFGGYVQWKSQINGTVNAGGSYSSSITSYSVSINGQSFNSRTFTTGTLSGGGTCKVTVTDSRGRQASKSVTYSVIGYSSPSITNLTAIRCNSDGTANDDGTYAKITVSASISSVNNKNNTSYILQYKPKTSGTWTSVTLATSGYSYNGSKIISNISTEQEYDVQVSVSDYFTTATAYRSISTAFVLVDYNASGQSISFGGVSTLAANDKQAEFKLWASFKKGIEVNGIHHYADKFTMSQGSAAWLYLGAWNASGDSDIMIINVYTGDGYNGGSAQNAWAKIFIKNGWQSSYSDAQSFGVVCEKHGYKMNGFQVYVGAWTHDGCDVFVYLPWSYWNGYYTVECSGGWWDDVATISNPKNTKQDVSYKYLLDASELYPVNSVYITYNDNNPGNFLGGTWVCFGQNRFMRGAGDWFSGGATGGSNSHTHGAGSLVAGYETFVYNGHKYTDYNRKSSPSYTQNVRVNNKSGVESFSEDGGFNETGDKGIGVFGSTASADNVPIFIAVYFWRRTA